MAVRIRFRTPIERSFMRRLIALALTILVAGAAVGAAQGASAVKTITGVVGPGFTISMNKKSVKAGKYKIVITDKSSIHNFHLRGKGFNKRTSVAKKGKTTWMVTLKKGTYRFVCDPHAASMKGTLKVT
jgi:plastocyanin